MGGGQILSTIPKNGGGGGEFYPLFQKMGGRANAPFALPLATPLDHVRKRATVADLGIVKGGFFFRECISHTHLRGVVHFFSGNFGRKKIINNSYFIFVFLFICQNVGNLKGFLLVCEH